MIACAVGTGSDAVTPIDTATNTALPVAVGTSPMALAITPNRAVRLELMHHRLLRGPAHVGCARTRGI